jgi:type IV secretion system protein TrbB
LTAAISESQARRFAALRDSMAAVSGLLEDERTIEVMLNADGQVWVERVGGGMVAVTKMNRDDAFRMLRLVATELGLELGERSPSISGKLPIWGARIQASIPPVVDGPVFALRKPARTVFTLEDYVAQKILTLEQAQILRSAVRARRNILVGGGTGTGKTTFANALLAELAELNERIFLVEDNPELQCAAPNRLQVLVQPPHYPWRRAILDALRFRPDRIVVGEVRDGAALDLLKAWNTGHPGGIATLHADSTPLMLDRLCQLIEEVIPQAPRSLVAQTIHHCVHLERDPSHPARRRVTGIERVLGVGRAGEWSLERAA